MSLTDDPFGLGALTPPNAAILDSSAPPQGTPPASSSGTSLSGSGDGAAITSSVQQILGAIENALGVGKDSAQAVAAAQAQAQSQALMATAAKVALALAAIVVVWKVVLPMMRKR